MGKKNKNKKIKLSTDKSESTSSTDVNQSEKVFPTNTEAAVENPTGVSIEDNKGVATRESEEPIGSKISTVPPEHPEGAYSIEDKSIIPAQQRECANPLGLNIIPPQQAEMDIAFDSEPPPQEIEYIDDDYDKEYSEVEDEFIKQTSGMFSERKSYKYIERETYREVDKLPEMALSIAEPKNTTVGQRYPKRKRDIPLHEKWIGRRSFAMEVINRLKSKSDLLDSPFINLYQRLKMNGQWSEVKNNFSPSSDYSTMLSYLWGMEDFHLVGNLSECKVASKDEKLVTPLLTLSHDFWKYGKYDKALETINKSLTYAETPNSPIYDQLLPQAYIKRSKLLFDLAEPRRSKVDIDRALYLNFVQNLSPEFRQIVERKAKAAENLTPDVSQVSYTLQYSGYIPHNFCCTNVHRNTNLKMQRKFPLHFNIRSIEVPRLDHPHPYIPSLTKSASIGYTEEKGRHLYAVEDIYPGTVIIREQSFSYSLHEHAVEKYCTFCLKRVADPVPCPGCSKVVFCDEECLAQGHEAFHAFECKILNILYAIESEDSPYAVLLVRILAKYPFELLKQNFATLRKEEAQRKEEAREHPEKTQDPSRLGFNGEFYSSTDYRPIYHLLNHKNKQDEERVIGACRDVLLILKALAEIEFFGTDVNLDENQPLPDEYKELGEILMRHYQAMLINTHKLHDSWFDENKKPCFSNYGVAISSVYSLLNNSCCPNASNFNYGSLNVVRAIDYIPKGSEITICYDKPFENLQHRYRDRIYRGLYYFECSCKACVERWPMIQEIESMFFIAFLECRKCGGNFEHYECNNCKSTTIEIPTRISGRDRNILTIEEAYELLDFAIADGCSVARDGINEANDYEELCRVISTLSLICYNNKVHTYFKRVLCLYFHNIAYHNHQKRF